MTCIRIPNGFVCVNTWGRLHLGSRYINIEFHPYCGPSFWWDRDLQKPYIPADENDPIWPLFDVWLRRHNAQLARLKKSRSKP